MASPVSIAVVGSGLIGKRHIQHVIDEPESNLVAIIEPLDSGAELAKKYGVPHYRSLDELIAEREAGNITVDGVIIGTPTQTHVDLGVQAVEAGLIALVEKPIASSAVEAEKLVEAVKGAKGKVLVGQHRRFNPFTVALKAAIESGKLGTLVAIQGCWVTKKGGSFGGVEYYSGWKLDRSGGGTVNINMIHDIDFLRFLMGDIASIYATEGPNTRGHDVDETGAVVITFTSGAVGTMVFSDASPAPFSWEGATGENPDLIGEYGKDVYTVFGTKGSIQVPSLQLYNFEHLADQKDAHWLSRLSVDNQFRDIALQLKSTPPFTLQLKHFIRVCRGEEEPSCDALEGFKSVQALEAVARSFRR